MISVLIPCYKDDPQKLVSQLLELNGDFEIVVGDDHSPTPFSFNEQDSRLRIIRNQSNLGYTANRNNLAREAGNDTLIFLDADVVLKNKDFLSIYQEILPLKPKKIICGGIEYGSKPTSPELVLKYLHGKEREQRSLKERIAQPGLSFHAGNFMIDRKTFLEFPMQSGGKTYGYNDTLYGLRCQEKGIEIEHIENRVENQGLIPAEEFLEKATLASKHLAYLSKSNDSNLLRRIRLYRKGVAIKSTGFSSLAILTINAMGSLIRSNLNSSNPSLLYFDLFRLGEFLRALNSSKRS